MRSVSAAAVFLLLAACAPMPKEPGPAVTTPKLTETAMIAEDGTALPVRSWLPDGPPKAVIAALHGMNDYSAFFDLPGPDLAAAGIAVYAYDQRGFGAAPVTGHWAGEALMCGDLYQFLRLLAARHPGTPLYVLGESMGGAVALRALSHPAIDGEDLPPLSGVILVAPALWSRDTMPWYQSAALWAGAHLIPWATVTGRGLNIMASDNIEMLRKMGRDPLVLKETRIDAIEGLVDLMDHAAESAPRFDLRALVQIAGKDEVIPNEASKATLPLLPPSAKIAFYPASYHMMLRDLRPEQPIADIVAFISGTAKQ